MGKNTSGVKYISMLENMEKIDFLAGSGCFNDFPGGQVVNDSSSNCVPLACTSVTTTVLKCTPIIMNIDWIYVI
jgi:hypothetical protein